MLYRGKVGGPLLLTEHLMRQLNRTFSLSPVKISLNQRFMSNPHQTFWPKILISWAAMLLGLGLLLMELMTGFLHYIVPGFVVWTIYLVLLLTSVWGMKTLLERQNRSHLRSAGYGSRKKSIAGRLSQQQSHNIFRLPIEGQIYVVMLAIMLLGALFGKTNTLMLIFALMAGPFIVNGSVTFAMTRKLFLSRKMPRRLMVGEPTSIEITIFNRKRIIPSALVTIEDQIIGPREQLTGKIVFAQVPANSSRKGQYQIRFMQRGRYTLGPARITSRFPLGIVERGRLVELYDEILIHPRIGILAEWWHRRAHEGSEVSRFSKGNAGPHHDEFHRIREYRPGDELRSIHWKTSARRNELMVREYRQIRDQRLLLILDLWQDGKSPEHVNTERNTDKADQQHALIENAVSLAATIGWKHIQECGIQQLDFICFGRDSLEWFGSRRGEQIHAWLDQLAIAEAGDHYSTANIKEEILKHQSASSRTVLVTTRSEEDITPEANGASSDAVHAYHGLLIVEAAPEKTKDFFQQTF